MYDYIHLHYTKQDGSKGVFRASPRHGIVLPTQAIPSSNPVPAPGPGTLKQMQMVVVSYTLHLMIVMSVVPGSLPPNSFSFCDVM
jgi:hypothetical protein